jgi:hypothetical protein
MFVTETSVSATSELTLQIDISMPNLATSQPDLSFSGNGLTPRTRNSKYYTNLRRNDRLSGSDIGLNNVRNKKQNNTGQGVYHRRCMAEDATSCDRSHGGSDPALSPSTNSHDSLQHKKPFITVVKSGKFLDPPHYKNNIHHNQSQQVLVYSYCSKPRAMPPTYKHRKSRDIMNNNMNNNINNNNNNNNEYKNHNTYNHTYYQTTNKQLLQTCNTRNKRSTDIYQQ